MSRVTCCSSSMTGRARGKSQRAVPAAAMARAARATAVVLERFGPTSGSGTCAQSGEGGARFATANIALTERCVASVLARPVAFADSGLTAIDDRRLNTDRGSTAVYFRPVIPANHAE